MIICWGETRHLTGLLAVGSCFLQQEEVAAYCPSLFLSVVWQCVVPSESFHFINILFRNKKINSLINPHTDKLKIEFYIFFSFLYCSDTQTLVEVTTPSVFVIQCYKL